MADSITIKSGALGDRAAMPKLGVDELGYRTDEKALYIGTKGKNERLCGADDVSEITAKLGALNQRIDDIITRLEALEPSEEPSE